MHILSVLRRRLQFLFQMHANIYLAREFLHLQHVICLQLHLQHFLQHAKQHQLHMTYILQHVPSFHLLLFAFPPHETTFLML